MTEYIHTVKEGDTLSKISQQYYRNMNYYKYLARFNNIENPDLITVGQEIKIPIYLMVGTERQKGNPILNMVRANSSKQNNQPPQTDTCIGFFFDGTGNNAQNDRPIGKDTNVAKLFELYERKRNSKGISIQQAYYHIGVGTDKEKWYDDWIETIALGPLVKFIKDRFTDKTLENFSGLLTGSGGQQRIKDAITQLDSFISDNPDAEVIKIDVFGFSRGAAIARHFVNLVHDYEKVRVRLLGIFDTVGSFGLGGNDVNIGYSLAVYSSRVDRVVHFIARHEYRSLFDLTSIKRLQNEHETWRSHPFNKYMKTKPLPGNMVERAFIGAHSDVGGGYQPIDDEGIKNTLSRIPLYAMVDEAIKAGVPLKPIKTYLSINPARESAFAVSDDLKKLLDARNNELQYEQLTDESQVYFMNIKKKYIHDSRYPIDGDSTSRDVFYHGVY